MADPALPILSMSAPAAVFARELGQSFRESGFALVIDHGLDPALLRQGWDLTRALFDLPLASKLAHHDPHNAGARGYTPFGREIAKGSAAHDLKEFWHIGRELPAGHPLLGPSMPANIWPDQPPGFRTCFETLFEQFEALGATILSRIALHLGLPENWFAPAIRDGNSVLRLLHYPPIAGDGVAGSVPAIRAAAHEDINLVTLLLGAEEAGLELLTREGTWLALAPPKGALVVNIGDMLERLTNGQLRSTTHRVRNPAPDRAGFGRYSMPFFLHLRSDFLLETLPCCVTPQCPDRFAERITADQFLQQRLRDIGLRRE